MAAWLTRLLGCNDAYPVSTLRATPATVTDLRWLVFSRSGSNNAATVLKQLLAGAAVIHARCSVEDSRGSQRPSTLNTVVGVFRLLFLCASFLLVFALRVWRRPLWLSLPNLGQ